ncbi:MAG: hypothetical protein CMC57_06265 [Flavobacteriaceae bacterium]|nr:hypothetical protein [Flavobacteriaceae bacterium]|tara:strand:- start:2110 stop:3006 length:897 start_codon:yes stop_codon:yes gene_type:complete
MNRINNFLFILLILLLSISCNEKDKSNSNIEENWISLFNGKDLDGWDIKFSGHNLNDNYNNTFQVEDGMIRVVYDEYETFDDKYGHMYYEKPFSYYKIRFDYRFLGEQTPGGESWNVRNSGIMLHSQSAKSNDLNQDFPVSIEIQLLGGLGKGPRTTGNLCTPGTQVVFNDKLDFTHCISSNSKTYDGDGWIHVEAIILGDQSITHIVEKDTVLVYEKPQITTSYLDDDWDRYGVTSKDYWKNISGKLLSEGYIAIQAESHAIDFKNIELLNLCGCMDKKAKNYKSYFIKEDNSLCKY